MFEKYDGENKEKREQKKAQKRRRKKHDKQEKYHEPKKRIGLLGKIIIALFALLLAAVVFVFGYIALSMNTIKLGDQSKVDPENEWFETDSDEKGLSAGDIKWYKGGETISDKAVTNILLIGQDRREGEGRTRADTMIVLSINRATNEITLVSLMRDMYVQIPGYSANKLNAAYAFGGMETLDEAITQNFGIIIDGNVEVDFTGFGRIIEELGGVDIEVTEAEAKMLNEEATAGPYKAGVQHLNAADALWYARNRSMGGYDYNRTERQRKLLMAIYHGMRKQPVNKIVGFVNTVFDFVTTDISSVQAINYAISVGSKLSSSTITSKRIPVDGTFYDAVVDGMMVLVPDLEWNQIYLKHYLYGSELRGTMSDKEIILRRIYNRHKKEIKKNGAFFKCALEMKAYGII